MNQKASRRDIVRVVTGHLLNAANSPVEKSKWLQRLAAYLVLHGKTDEVDLVINDIAHEMQIQAGIVTVEVVSARALSAELRASLKTLLQKETDAKQIIMHEMTDKALLGGFVARTADAEIDASVRTKLRALAALA